MYKNKGPLLMRLLVIAVALAGSGLFQHAWGADTGTAPNKPVNSSGNAGQQVNTLHDATKQAAEIRKSKGRMRSTTNDDRVAAAKRHADRHAADLKARGEGKGENK